MNPETVVERCPVLERRLLDGYLVRRAELDARPVALKGTAASLWRRVDAAVRVADVVVHLADEYRASPDEVGPDVLVALAELVEQRLIAVIDG